MKCLYIYNPTSGKGKAKKKRQYIVSKLQSHFDGLDVVETTHPGHAKDLASDACGKYDVLCVAGGDGTLNEVINGVAGHEVKPTLAYIPLGTVNDFAHSTCIPRSIKGAVDNIINGTAIEHDIFKVNDNFGIYVCGAGVFTESSYSTDQKTKKALGKVAYFVHGIKKVFTTQSLPMKIQYEGGEIEDKFAIFLAINSRYVAGFKLNNNFKYNDGIVDVLLVENKKKIVSLHNIFKVFKIFLLGVNRKASHGMVHLRLSTFKITSPQQLYINIDGENIISNEINFSVIKQGIKIIVPNNKKLKNCNN